MIKPSLQLEEQENISESRILFEEVMVDNEPTQEQVLERAQQLQIDDLSLARQSLTKELQPFWRPYMNRYGDIYYINLKDRKAYIDHPIDMETKILYSKRRKILPPKFRAFQFEDVSNSLHLIEQEIRKWKKTELLKSTQTIPSQLNIVYEESEESNTQRQKSVENEYSDEEYIENLQKSQQENTRSRRSTPREQKESFNIGYKKFPVSQTNENELEEQNDEIELTPQYERLLIEYEEQVKKQHQKQLQIYREQKQLNYVKKEQLCRQGLKAKIQRQKFNLLTEFESQIEQKNFNNFQKQTHKMIMEYRQKLIKFQQKLQRQRSILQNLQQTHELKQEFILSLEQKMQHRVNHGKYLISEKINKQMHQVYFVSKIDQVNLKCKEDFTRESHKIMNDKMNQLIRQKGILTEQRLHSSSLTSFYQDIVKKQFKKIDKLLLQNQISRQMRKRTKSIFKNEPENDKIQSHIVFLQSERQISNKNDQKQNNFNEQNIIHNSRTQKQKIIEQIEKDILKSTQNNSKFYQRRNKIFGGSHLSQSDKIHQTNKKELQGRIFIKETQQNNTLKINNYVDSKAKYLPDRKSMYLRMMKRIL